jgi:hypothetical protein
MPTHSAIHGTKGYEHHAYTNMPAGKSTAAPHAVCKRASGPRFGAERAYSRSWYCQRANPRSEPSVIEM